MTYDVVIIGGGVIGSAIAYFLAQDQGFGGRIAVIERDPTYRTASSALSASSIRQQFSTAVNIAISRYGISFLRDIGTHLAVDGSAPEIGLREPGYLYLASPEGLPVLQENHRIQRAEDVKVALLDPAGLVERFPWISNEGIAAASLGLAGEGWFDGYSVMQAFRAKARSLGVTYINGEAVAMERDGGRIAAVILKDGQRLACGHVVNAGGPHARAVAAMAGIALPVEARRRSVFVMDCRRQLADCPLVIDISGIWFRPEGEYFIAGMAPPEGEDPERFELEVDHYLFDEVMWPALATRVPAFEALKVVNAWAGQYEMNTFDHNAILGAHPDVANLMFANGFSGHGLQQSPAVGRGIAELIVHGRYRSLDLTPLSFQRVLENRPLRELNII